MISVKDGSRVLKFSGSKIAQSSSFDSGKSRWIEFHLYITDSGNYVLSRIGASRLVHTNKCETVYRNKIKDVPREDIDMSNANVCLTCRKMPGETTSNVLYPEVPRYWASVTDSAESVVENLYKEDNNGDRYLTDVAKRLLEDALEKDHNIADAYLTEYID